MSFSCRVISPATPLSATMLSPDSLARMDNSVRMSTRSKSKVKRLPLKDLGCSFSSRLLKKSEAFLIETMYLLPKSLVSKSQPDFRCTINCESLPDWATSISLTAVWKPSTSYFLTDWRDTPKPGKVMTKELRPRLTVAGLCSLGTFTSMSAAPVPGDLNFISIA